MLAAPFVMLYFGSAIVEKNIKSIAKRRLYRDNAQKLG